MVAAPEVGVRPPPPPARCRRHHHPTTPTTTPPRSRVFLVVPRAADPGALAAALASLAPPASLAWFKGDLVGAKGVCYAKFHTASSALTALEAIADAGGLLAGVRVKGMLAEPRSARAGASGGGGGSAVVAATAAAGAAAASASTSTAAAAPSASAPVASGASWDGAAAASRGSGAPDASTSSRRSGRGRRRRGRRGAGGGGAAAAAEDGGDDPPALSLPALHALAAMRGGLGPLGGRGWGADAAPSSLFSDGARPPPAPAAAASARTAPSPSPSSDSVQPASDDEDVAVGQPPGQPPPPPRASRRRRAATSATSAAAATAADVAAVREGLAHMRTADDDADVGLAALGLGGGGDDDDAAAPVAPPPNRTIYTTLTRPLPAYALEHVLSAHGALVSVALRPSAPRHAVAVFADARAARAARDALDGSRVLGERLSVALVDPLVEGGASVPLTKRQRVGGGVVE